MTARDRNRKFRKIARQRWPGAKVTGVGEFAVLYCGAPPWEIVLFSDMDAAHSLARTLNRNGCCPDCPIPAGHLTHGVAWIREDGRPPLAAPLTFGPTEPIGEGGS